MDTKGEWKVDPHSYDSAQMVVTTDGKLIANCFKSIANAHLIAAAPAMYEALEHTSMSIHHPACSWGKTGSGNTCNCHVGKAIKALALARGE
ncbi:hypothetical protein LCGC14_2975880 [marine sediment metagenome]|uniref:Uncharacterized protein n=1 Tax=marine sediment metagenome TaxID=412755 RepID=A0A0F8X8X9_9ZZZZ